jgi:hypothetical protein
VGTGARMALWAWFRVGMGKQSPGVGCAAKTAGVSAS